MNCFNQQSAGMTGYGVQNGQAPSWQMQPVENEMFGWPEPMMPDMDPGMPPSTIPSMRNNIQPNNMQQGNMPQSNMPHCGMRQNMMPQNPMPQNPMPQNMMTNHQPMSFGMQMENGMFPLAMSYVPMQKWSQPSPMEEGFRRGTMFRELDLPFVMGRCQ